MKAAAMDPDIRLMPESEIRAKLKAFGPATRIESPQIRKSVREARAALDRGDLGMARSALQYIRDLRVKAARRAAT